MKIKIISFCFIICIFSCKKDVINDESIFNFKNIQVIDLGFSPYQVFENYIYDNHTFAEDKSILIGNVLYFTVTPTTYGFDRFYSFNIESKQLNLLLDSLITYTDYKLNRKSDSDFFILQNDGYPCYYYLYKKDELIFKGVAPNYTERVEYDEATDKIYFYQRGASPSTSLKYRKYDYHTGQYTLITSISCAPGAYDFDYIDVFSFGDYKFVYYCYPYYVLACYDSNFNFIWSRQWNQPNYNWVSCINADNNFLYVGLDNYNDDVAGFKSTIEKLDISNGSLIKKIEFGFSTAIRLSAINFTSTNELFLTGLTSEFALAYDTFYPKLIIGKCSKSLDDLPELKFVNTKNNFRSLNSFNYLTNSFMIYGYENSNDSDYNKPSVYEIEVAN